MPLIVLIVLGIGLYWGFDLGPKYMLSAIQRGDAHKISVYSHWGISPDSDVLLVGGLVHCAVASGQIQLLAQLHDLGANLNRVDGNGATPLHVAIKFQQIECVRWLIAHGADPGAKDRSGTTPAIWVNQYISPAERPKYAAALAQRTN